MEETQDYSCLNTNSANDREMQVLEEETIYQLQIASEAFKFSSCTYDLSSDNKDVVKRTWSTRIPLVLILWINIFSNFLHF